LTESDHFRTFLRIAKVAFREVQLVGAGHGRKLAYVLQALPVMGAQVVKGLPRNGGRCTFVADTDGKGRKWTPMDGKGARVDRSMIPCGLL